MMKLYEKCFSIFCEIAGILNLILSTVIGGTIGKFMKEIIGYNSYLFYKNQYLLICGFALLGLLIGFFINFLVFGTLAQIVEIRKSLKKIEENKE